jgi:hypothetical protein
MTEERYSRWELNSLDRRLRELERRVGYRSSDDLDTRLRKLEHSAWLRELNRKERPLNIFLGVVIALAIAAAIVAVAT